MKTFEVKSDRDNGVVFDAASVAEQAALWRVRPLVAARRLAKQHTDELTGEQLFVAEVA